MAIKINLMPKREDGVTGGESRRPFYFLIVFVFFIVSSLVYFGIYSYNTFFLKKQLDAIEKKNADIQEEVSKSAMPEDLLAVASVVTKGKSVKSILSAHLYVSKIYELLEKLTIKSVTYNTFSEKIIDDNTVNLSIGGEADSFNALAKQLIIFKKSKEIKEVIFEKAELEQDSKVKFSVVLNFDLKIITARPVITVSGPSLITITVGSKYSDAGATAIDGVDGHVPIVTSGLVDTNVAGTYTLTYSAVNTAGNSSVATRTINVMAPPDKTIFK